MKQAEVIAIGDELTSGQRLDTNSQWLSQRLGELGIRVVLHTTIADNLEMETDAFRQAFERVDFVICTGGLGPTADDLTRHALAEAAQSELELREDALEHIKSLFARRRREMPERNNIQAMFPSGSRVIPNPHGTAPGIDMSIPREGADPCRVFALPGVPAEMREMWDQTVEPALLETTGERRIIRHHCIKCFGVGESDLEQMLPDLIRRGRSPSVGITVSRATITLRVTADGSNPEECRILMQPTIETIHGCLGNLVFGEQDDELQHAVVRLLNTNRSNVSVAEWGAGGLLSRWLSEADDSGNAFVGGVVIRNEAAAIKLGGVPSDLLDRVGPHDRQIAGAMARHSQQICGSEYALAITKLPDSSTNTPGRVAFGLACFDDLLTTSVPFAGHPDILEARATKQALNMLRLKLIESAE